MYELKDILWEFTLKCNRNCEFCGSRDIINKCSELESSLEKKRKIAEDICDIQSVNKVTFTGGEATLDPNFIEIVELIKSRRPDIRLNVVTNGYLFEQGKQLPDGVGAGISINTLDDIEIASKYVNKLDKKMTTMITNFGNHNIDLFLQLKSFSANFGLWQVQLTIDDSLQLSKSQIKELISKLGLTVSFEPMVIRADNFNNGSCEAGRSSCAITAFGEVIPCLSYRSWRKTIDSQGVISESDSLSKIWNEGFAKYRTCDDCICCKDITKIKEINANDKEDGDWFTPAPQHPSPIKQPDCPNDAVYTYGVILPRDTVMVMYGVTIGDEITSYVNESTHLNKRKGKKK